jgi:gamma-D-glutamyl-L-lysine dipeptidyl-peptidase
MSRRPSRGLSGRLAGRPEGVSEHAPARCIIDIASVRREPRDDAEQVTQLVVGEPVDVGEDRDGWALIRTAYGYPGWVRAEALGSAGGRGQGSTWLVPVGGADVVEEARRYLGAPYEWGGMTARGIDCSGLVHMAYRRTGRLIPRDADQQEAAGERVAETELRAGDLVTYGAEERADHIAFWLGDGRILHSTGREGANGVVEEQEPAQLRARRRRLVRFP